MVTSQTIKRRHEVSIKTVFAKVALATLALALTAPQAIAATPELHPVEGGFPVAAFSTLGTINITMTPMGIDVACASGTAVYNITSKTTIERSMRGHECKETSSGEKCTTLGQPNGTVTFITSVSHLVYLDENHTKPGILTTPPAGGAFASFKCGSSGTIELKGNGLLTEITSPACWNSSDKLTVVAATSAPGTQKYLQVEETGTKYDMNAIAGLLTVGFSGTESMTTQRAMLLTCPEQK